MGKLVKNEKKDEFYKIIEMRDGFKDGIDSLTKTIDGQNELIEFLKTAPENKFKDTVIDLISQNEQFKQQKASIIIDITLLKVLDKLSVSLVILLINSPLVFSSNVADSKLSTL